MLLGFAMVCFGQNSDIEKEEDLKILESKMELSSKLIFLNDCKLGVDLAKMDIDNKSVKILLVGGSSPTIYTSDSKFEKKYQVKFIDFGCISPNIDCIVNYNFTVFDYLKKEHGRRWIKEVRKDAIGLRNWKKQKKHRKQPNSTT